jgi:hypothetical protein
LPKYATIWRPKQRWKFGSYLKKTFAPLASASTCSLYVFSTNTRLMTGRHVMTHRVIFVVPTAVRRPVECLSCDWHCDATSASSPSR